MVEWKELWEVTTWDKKFTGVDKLMQPKIIRYHYYLASELSELEDFNGDIRILYTTEKVAYANSSEVEANVSEGEVVAIPWGGNPSVKYYKGKFITADNRIATSNNIDILDNKYLYYWMFSQLDTIAGFYRGAGIKHPSMVSILKMQIPIPSKSEQERIVSILDTFTSSISNLKEQIKERRKQYEYYRDQLLDLEGKDGVEMKKIKEVCDTMSGYPFDSSRFSENGIRLMRGMNVKRGYFDFSEDLNKYWSTSDGLESYLLKENDIIISMDGSLVGRSFSYVNKDLLPLLLVQRVARLRAKENYKYIYYNISKSFPQYVDKKKTAGAIPHISMRDINDFIIPIPSPTEQSRIVTILDQFEASIANLEAQLKEREKQYEYYRNQLLTFE